MADLRGNREGSPLQGVAWAALVWGTPAVIYGGLRRFSALDPSIGSGTGHFVIVSLVALLALGLALAVARAALHLPDPRTFFLSMGFLAMAAIFVAHGAGTAPFYGHAHGVARAAHEDAGHAYHDATLHASAAAHPGPAVASTAIPPRLSLDARTAVVGFSARLSLLVSALCFALATVDLRQRIADTVVRWWMPLAGLFALVLTGYAVTALLFPQRLMWIPLSSAWLSWLVASATWIALGFAGLRFGQSYRLAALPLQGTMALTMGLLAEAQWIMLRGPVWHLSWWEYHVLMLAGFLAAVIALLRQYRSAGDLGVVVEGLFLRRAVTDLRAGDPAGLLDLAAAVAAKDSETGEHTERVGEMAVAVGRRLGIPGDRLNLLRWAGRLHDVGKIGVPNAILNKPGPLTESEFAVMQRHSPRGWRIAVRSRMLAEAAPIIRAHHERLDGSGYPDGLYGDAIPLEARIIAVADVWDALTCDRPYRAALSEAQAAAILCKESGMRLDLRCVSALFAELESRAWKWKDERAA